MSIRGILKDYLEEFEYEKIQRESILVAMDKLEKSANAVERIEAFAERYKDGELDFDGIKAAAEEAAESLGVHPYQSNFIHLTPLYRDALPYYEKEGLGREEWYDSFIDFKWKMGEQYKLRGIYGITGADWFKRFYTAERIAFGRLQFNLLSSERTFKGDTVDVKEGQTVVTIHIPSDTRTPFSKENRELSYARAAKYYSKFFEGGKVIFRCGTWLLHPAHRSILPESSNIRSFLDDFELDFDSFKEDAGNLWRIFYITNYNGDPSTLPESSSLMRAYKKYMLEGGKLGTMVGFRIG